MFLTQEHVIAGISADSNRSIDTSSKESVWQNVAVFQDPENVLQDDSTPSYQATFSIHELSQKLITRVFRYIFHRS